MSKNNLTCPNCGSGEFTKIYFVHGFSSPCDECHTMLVSNSHSLDGKMYVGIFVAIFILVPLVFIDGLHRAAIFAPLIVWFIIILTTSISYSRIKFLILEDD